MKRCTIANLSSIGKGGQKKLASSCVGIAGLGGVGGIAFELLVRAGVGSLKISDSGFFEESNANRQSLWTRKEDGRKKIAVAQRFARGVNPNVRVLPFQDITAISSQKFASGCAAVIDATDRAASRKAVFSGCCKFGVPYIFASALGTRGMLTVFAGKDMPAEFGMKKCPLPYLACDHSLGPVSNLVGCLSAQQAINIILGKPAVEFPSIVSIDAFSNKPLITHKF